MIVGIGCNNEKMKENIVHATIKKNLWPSTRKNLVLEFVNEEMSMEHELQQRR